MSFPPLTPEEFAALVAIDGSLRMQRPSSAMELRLRSLGLIRQSRFGGLPVRTSTGEKYVQAGNSEPPPPAPRKSDVLRS